MQPHSLQVTVVCMRHAPSCQPGSRCAATNVSHHLQHFSPSPARDLAASLGTLAISSPMLSTR